MIEAIICKNCGGSSFIRKQGRLICSYCATQYKEEYAPRRSRKNIWLAIGALVFTTFVIVWFLVSYGINNSGRKSTTSQNQKLFQSDSSLKKNRNQYARENIDKIKGWSLEKYNNIQRAEQIVSAESKYPIYQNGMHFSDLERSVGYSPDSLKESRVPGNKIEGIATWSTGSSLKDGEVTISISYDKETGQILRKDLMGNIYDKE